MSRACVVSLKKVRLIVIFRQFGSTLRLVSLFSALLQIVQSWSESAMPSCSEECSMDCRLRSLTDGEYTA